jgi:hypothetical protein
MDKAVCIVSRGVPPLSVLVAPVADKMVHHITLLAPLPYTVQEQSSAQRQIEGDTAPPPSLCATQHIGV